MNKEAKEYHHKWIHDKKDLRDRFEVMEGYAQSQLEKERELRLSAEREAGKNLDDLVKLQSQLKEREEVLHYINSWGVVDEKGNVRYTKYSIEMIKSKLTQNQSNDE